MSITEIAKPAAQAMPSLQDYAPIVGEPEIIEIRELARRLAGRRVKMVNSTAVGGGVAEILNRLVPLMAEVGLATTTSTRSPRRFTTRFMALPLTSLPTGPRHF